MILPLALLAAASLAAASPALSCSVVEDYRVPTNMELVAGADLILLATVADSAAAPDSVPQQHIVLHPVAALKGTMPTGPQVLTAMIATGTDALLSNPYELREAHPQPALSHDAARRASSRNTSRRSHRGRSRAGSRT